MNVISPLEIPLILDIVGQYLTKLDYANCTLVSKSWNRLFKPLLWSSLVWKKQSFEQTDHKQPLFRNTELLRKLTIDMEDTNFLLRYFSHSNSPCRNLVEFNCVTNHLSCIGNVIRNNKNLKKCAVYYSGMYYTEHALARLTEVISTHSSLKRFSLKAGWKVRWGEYVSLLQNLPITLEALDLPLTVTEKGRDIDSRKNSAWRDVYPRLRSLTVKISTGGKEGEAILQLIQRSPALERIVVTDSTGGLPEFVKIITRHSLISAGFCLQSTSIRDEEWRKVAPVLQNRINYINIENPIICTSGDGFYASLTSQFSTALVEFRLDEKLDVSCRYIEQILESCPMLKTFVAFCNPRSRHLGIQAIYKGDPSDTAKDWACLQLETLELKFQDGRRMIAGTRIHGYLAYNYTHQEDWTIKGIKRAYRMIGKLTKLQHLRIGWYTHESFRHDINLDFSIKSGLELLDGLKKLRVLDVRSIQHVNIGQKEVEWILGNWPGLRELRGIIYKSDNNINNNTSSDDQEVLEHIKWLHLKKPYITVY